MADNFNMKQFLAENKMGPYAKANKAKVEEATKYQPGDMWSSDFDYKGMLKAAANLSVSSPEELMQAISDSFEDVNYHRENSHLQDAIEAKKENDNDAIKFHLALFKDELKKTINNLKETQIFEREKVEEGHEEGMADMIHMEEGEAAYEYEKGKEAGEKEEKEKMNEAFKYFDNYQDFEDTLFQLYPQVKANPEKYKKERNGEVSYSDGYVNWASWNPNRPQSPSGLPPGAVNMDNKMSQSDLIYPAGSRMDETDKKEEVKEALSPEMFERMDALTSHSAQIAMIKAAEIMMNELTDEGFEVLDIREYFTQLIANDI